MSASLPEPVPFHCEVTTSAGRTTIRVAGDLDLATVDELEARLEEAMGGDAAQVVVDLRELTFLDSVSVGRLLHWARLSARDGDRLAMLPPGKPVDRALVILGVVDLLPFADPERVDGNDGDG